jgi:hypothetical protein
LFLNFYNKKKYLISSLLISKRFKDSESDINLLSLKSLHPIEGGRGGVEMQNRTERLSSGQNWNYRFPISGRWGGGGRGGAVIVPYLDLYLKRACQNFIFESVKEIVRRVTVLYMNLPERNIEMPQFCDWEAFHL